MTLSPPLSPNSDVDAPPRSFSPDTASHRGLDDAGSDGEGDEEEDATVVVATQTTAASVRSERGGRQCALCPGGPGKGQPIKCKGKCGVVAHLQCFDPSETGKANASTYVCPACCAEKENEEENEEERTGQEAPAPQTQPITTPAAPAVRGATTAPAAAPPTGNPAAAPQPVPAAAAPTPPLPPTGTPLDAAVVVPAGPGTGGGPLMAPRGAAAVDGRPPAPLGTNIGTRSSLRRGATPAPQPTDAGTPASPAVTRRRSAAEGTASGTATGPAATAAVAGRRPSIAGGGGAAVGPKTAGSGRRE